MVNSGHPVTPDGVTCGDLEALFEERFPGIQDENLAALIAQFIEEIPFAATMTSDGVLVPIPSQPLKIPAAVSTILEDLKTIAGDAYPYFRRQAAS